MGLYTKVGSMNGIGTFLGRIAIYVAMPLVTGGESGILQCIKIF